MPDDEQVAHSEGRGSPEAIAVRTRRARREVEHAARKRQCLELRRRGRTFTEIGIILGRSEAQCRRMYRAALKDFYRAPAEEERELALLRCDGLITRWWPVMMGEPDREGGERPTIEQSVKASRQVSWAMSFAAELQGIKAPPVTLIAPVVVDAPTFSEVWNHLEAYRRASAEPPAAIEASAVVSGNGTPPTGNGTAPE